MCHGSKQATNQALVGWSSVTSSGHEKRRTTVFDGAPAGQGWPSPRTAIVKQPESLSNKHSSARAEPSSRLVAEKKKKIPRGLTNLNSYGAARHKMFPELKRCSCRHSRARTNDRFTAYRAGGLGGGRGLGPGEGRTRCCGVLNLSPDYALNWPTAKIFFPGCCWAVKRKRN